MEKMEIKRDVLNELNKYPYPLFFWGREHVGTVNAPFQLLHYILKDKVVQVEVGDEIHEWVWVSHPELKIMEARTYEVIEVRCFD